MNLIDKRYFPRIGAHNVKFRIAIGTAAPGSSFATLGQKGINMGKMCVDFNERSKAWLKEFTKDVETLVATKYIEQDVLQKLPLMVKMRIYQNKTYDLRISKPAVATLIKALSKVDKCSKTPGKVSAGKINLALLRAIAIFKLEELSAIRNEEAALKSVRGTAISMGFSIIES